MKRVKTAMIEILKANFNDFGWEIDENLRINSNTASVGCKLIKIVNFHANFNWEFFYHNNDCIFLK